MGTLAGEGLFCKASGIRIIPVAVPQSMYNSDWILLYS